MKLTAEQITALAKAGFQKDYVSAEEHEDGVGATVGVNFIKNAGTNQCRWYTPREALKEIGLFEKDETDFAREAMQREQNIAAEKEQLGNRVAATGLKKMVDWSWDDFRYQVGSMIEESEHFAARQYLMNHELVGFIIEDKETNHV